MQLVLRIIAELYRLEAAWDETKVVEQRAALRQEHVARSLKLLRWVVLRLKAQALP